MTVPIIHAPRSRRQRKPTLRSALRAAEKAGRDVKSATIETTGDIRLEFGKPGEAAADNTNEWDQALHHGKH